MSRERRNTRRIVCVARPVGAILAIVLATSSGHAALQTHREMNALVEVLRPVLPFPVADVNRDVPVRGGESARWFVIWPEPDERTVIVRANPLHPDIQALGAEAMARIQEAVEAAERKAQAAYDRAVKELQQTGKATNLDTVTLEDEGAAGERIDAELELTIALERVESFEIGSSQAPQVESGTTGATWTITTPANTYKESAEPGARERFRAAEARLVFGSSPKPTVNRLGNLDRYRVTLVPTPGTVLVALRGNEGLLTQALAKADWSKLVRKAP
jgi:hypothetical protein